ncbi:MAG: glycosyltransferase [Candidatus Eisenbacteria bacterium]|uniref:Glycosyltransferase n=1 Tax=Eiseniibacteriota bacterium TaxID=2212470 RepID=A0A538U6F1_UNCEI|nr:MAG: glycosyltransferase [Candidatus Eisenbacteria bacterium]
MRTLAVFARWPEPGRVKTRLAPALPQDLACALQRAMLEDTLRAARGARADRRVLAWAEAPADPLPTVPGFEIARQRGEDLGARLAFGFDALLAAGGPVVITGADAPETEPARLDAALDALAASDLVLGATLDGGYDLVGLAAPAPGLFAGISWSTPRARAETEDRARARDLRLRTLEPIADVDTPADLVALIGRMLVASAPPRATTTALADMGLLPR